MINAMYATKKDHAAVNHYLNWPITDMKNWWFPSREKYERPGA